MNKPKLSLQDVVKIRLAFYDGETRAQLAYKYNVCEATISHALNRPLSFYVGKYRRAKYDITKITINKIEYIQLKAYNYAKSKNMHTHAEDFAQYVLMKKIEGSTKHIRYFFADFCRLTFGRTDKYGTESTKLKSNEMLHSEEYKDERYYGKR